MVAGERCSREVLEMNILAAQSMGHLASRSAAGYSAGESKITAVHKLAVCYYTQKKYDQAERLYRSALDGLRNSIGEKDPEFGQLLNNLARLYHTQGKYDQAEPLYRQSLAVVERHFGEHHPKAARRLANLAGLYFSMGRSDESMVHYQRAIAILERELGPTHSTTVKTKSAYAAMRKTMNQSPDTKAIEGHSAAAEFPPQEAPSNESNVLRAHH